MSKAVAVGVVGLALSASMLGMGFYAGSTNLSSGAQAAATAMNDPRSAGPPTGRRRSDRARLPPDQSDIFLESSRCCRHARRKPRRRAAGRHQRQHEPDQQRAHTASSATRMATSRSSSSSITIAASASAPWRTWIRWSRPIRSSASFSRSSRSLVLIRARHMLCQWPSGRSRRTATPISTASCSCSRAGLMKRLPFASRSTTALPKTNCARPCSPRYRGGIRTRPIVSGPPDDHGTPSYIVGDEWSSRPGLATLAEKVEQARNSGS